MFPVITYGTYFAFKIILKEKYYKKVTKNCGIDKHAVVIVLPGANRLNKCYRENWWEGPKE